jgi:SpoIID/LytB domain protein
MPARVSRVLRSLTQWALASGTTLLVVSGCGLGRGGAVADEGGLHADPSDQPLPPTHLAVPPPPPVSAPDPRLWVALGARLGTSQPLVLQAASGTLTLITASGQRHQGRELLLRWRSEPLDPPLRISRRVLGPFASYESAEEASRRWQQQGVRSVIAHPADWEVWAPAGAPPLAGEQPEQAGRVVELELRQRLRPELQLASGSVPLEGPLQLQAPGGLRWRGGVFAGPFRLQPDAYGSWTLVEQVPLERYLLGVVPHEIGAGSPPAALAAQAVLARTWALRNQGRYSVDGYHLCSDTQCQVYGDPGHAGAAVRQAVAATRLQLLSWQAEPIHAVYHATNGGVAAGFEEVWSGAPLPYLQPRLDGLAALQQRFLIPLAPGQVGSLLATRTGLYGASHPRFRWSRSLDAAQIAATVRPLAPNLGTPTRLAVLERGPSGRVLALQIQGSRGGAGGSVVLRRDAIRRHLRSLPSTLFLVSPEGPGRWRFQGGGFGHGAGLSQAGAIELADKGWSAARILAHYYPGTSLVNLDQLSAGPARGAP